MNLPNHSLLDLITSSDAELTAADAEDLFAFQRTVEHIEGLVATAKRQLQAELVSRYEDSINAAYAAKGVDTGKVKFNDDAVVVEVNIPKRITWDNISLEEAGHQLAKIGENPNNYIKTKRTVNEVQYKALPQHYRDILRPARVEGVGTIKVTLVTPADAEQEEVA